MADLFRVSEITAQHLARAAYPLIHAVHRDMTLKAWLDQVKALDSPDGSRGIIAIQATSGTVLAVFTYSAVIEQAQPAELARTAPRRVLLVTEIGRCELPGLDLQPMIAAEARRLAEHLACDETVIRSDTGGLPPTSH